MGYTRGEILGHYGLEAERHDLAGTCTIQDIRTRRLEMDAIFGQLRDGIRVLEIGCGNGYVAQIIVEKYDIDLDAVDFSQEMIELAQARDTGSARGRVTFCQQDVLQLEAVEAYDLVFTERCLQNLVSWEDQQSALSRIAASLRLGGQFVMLESFWTGRNTLNAAREELDLPAIDPPWHNLLFDEEAVMDHLMSEGCNYVDQDRFLSGYYFGSRVLLPALAPEGKKISAGSVLNDYFCGLPPHGDFCPMKILRFERQ